MFESFDLTNFGKRLSIIRNDLQFSQESLHSISGVSCETIRRIEKGRVTPRYETLSLLSTALHCDLLEIFKNYRYSSELYNYYQRLDSLILKFDVDTLQNLNIDFHNSILNQEFDLINKNILDQFEELIKGIEQMNNNKFNDSLETFIYAMTLSSSNFSIDNYTELAFTMLEKRILICIGHTLSNIDVDKSISIFQFLLSSSNLDPQASKSEELNTINIYYNLSNNYHLNDEHHLAVEYATLGINYCNKVHSSFALSRFYFRRGIGNYLSGNSMYMDDLKIALYTSKAFNEENLFDIYLSILKNKYLIPIDFNR